MSFISLFSDERGFIATNQRVFSAEELQPLQQVLDQAQQLAHRLAQQGDIEARSIEEAARKGYADGLAAAQEQVRTEKAEMLKELHEQHQHVVHATQVESAALAVDIVRKVAGQIQSDEWLLAQATHAADELVDQAVVKLRVQAAQADQIKQRLDAMPNTRISQVISDDTLPPDGCILETATGQVEVDLDTQLNRILALFANDQPVEDISSGA